MFENFPLQGLEISSKETLKRVSWEAENGTHRTLSKLRWAAKNPIGTLDAGEMKYISFISIRKP
jgi:hypothetical protein